MSNPKFIVHPDGTFEPFDMTIIPNESDISSMPDIREESETIPGKDGEIPLEITYAPRHFDFVLWTKEGLTEIEKEELKAKIADTLNVARKQDCELLFLKTRRTYYVRLAGRFEITQEWATWFECRIPLKAYDPFGYETFERRKRGTFDLRNYGNEDADTTVYISGAIDNPSFVADGVRYYYDGSIPEGAQLVIDSKTQTAYIENKDGEKTNALQGWCGKFLTIPPGSIRVLADFKVRIVHRNKWI